MGIKNIIGGLTLNGKEVATVDQVNGALDEIGDIEAALDSIIAIQESLIGGNA